MEFVKQVFEHLNLKKKSVNSPTPISDPIISDNDKLQEDIVDESKTFNKEAKNLKYQDCILTNLISLKMTLAQNMIKLSKNEQSFAVKLSVLEDQLEKYEALTQKEEDDSGDATVDVFCVIDISGSMCGEKLNQVKQSLKYLIELLKPEDRISLVVFDDRAELILAPKLIGKSREQILAIVDNIKSRGSTNIGAGIKVAFEEMLKRKSKNQVTGVLLLSDGQDNCFFNRESNITKFYEAWDVKMKNEDFTLHTFGYGDGHDEKLMDNLAKRNGGKFYYVKDIETVSDTFVDCLAALYSVIGKNGRIKLNLKPNELFSEICFKRTYGPYFTGDKETERFIELNNIIKGYKKDFIFEITVNGVKEPNCLVDENVIKQLVSANLEVQNLSGISFNIVDVLEIKVCNEDDASEIVKSDDVDKDLIRVRGSEALEEAMDCAKRGDYEAGEMLMEKVEEECCRYDTDDFVVKMKENFTKNREMIKNERMGISNDCNMQAYGRNIQNCYMEQESAPQFMKGAFENKTRQKYGDRLGKMKKC